MELKQASSPFKFVTQGDLTQITPWKAKTIGELVVHLKTVPGSVIHYHTHRFLKQHQFLAPEPPNDFAYWVDTALQEERLAEKLFSIDTIRFETIRDLREKIVKTIENYLLNHPDLHEAPVGNEFIFMESVSFVIPTPFEAWNLQDFASALKKISINSLYHHIFEARIRHLELNDFSHWLATSLEEKKLAELITRMDPYTQTLEGLRERIIRMIEIRLKEIENAKSS